MNYKIPVYRPNLTGNEKKYVNECLDSTWISSKGHFINLFENQFSEYIGVAHSAAVSNGTVAIHLCLLALGIGPGDEVIVPTFTYIASVNAITYTGAKPVFVDSLKDTWQIDPEDIKRKITSKTKAIMAVHLFGLPCEMDSLQTICNNHGLFLIEDCAEALGTYYKKNHVGTFGDISSFSFFGNKTITTGEGGMVVTNNPDLHDKVMRLKGQGLSKNREYWHDIVGYNYRMTNICAAIGVAQLEKVDQFLLRKREIAQMYKQAFLNSGIIFHDEFEGLHHSYWMCSVLVANEKLRDDLREMLKRNGIETRPLFHPAHTMPIYQGFGTDFPIAEMLGKNGITLPSFPNLKDEEVNLITKLMLEHLNQNA